MPNTKEAIGNPLTAGQFNRGLGITNGDQIVEAWAPFHEPLKLTEESMTLRQDVSHAFSGIGYSRVFPEVNSIGRLSPIEASRLTPYLSLSHCLDKHGETGDRLKKNLGRDRYSMLDNCLNKSFGLSHGLMESVDNSFFQRPEERPTYNGEARRIMSHLYRVSIWRYIRTILELQAGFLVVGDEAEAEKYGSFGKLFSQGTFIFGLDSPKWDFGRGALSAITLVR